MSDTKKPSEKIISNAIDGKEVIDSAGRKIKLKKPDELDMYDAMSALGDDAKNSYCSGQVIVILHIATIDSQVIEAPKSYADVRMNIKRVKAETIEAVVNFLSSAREEEEKERLEKIKK